MKNTSESAAPKWLVEFASELHKIRSVADELGDLGKTSLQVLANVGRINNAIESTSTKLSFVSTSAELARFTELSAKVKSELEEALKWRSAFTDELKPQSDKDIAAFVSKMLEYKPNGLTMEEAKCAETPAAKAYCWYSLSIMRLSTFGENLADWLECKAAALTGETKQPPVKAVLVGGQAEQLAAANENTEWLKSEEARKKSNREKVGRENQRNGEKNDNGRKTDEKLKNQIMTEVRQMMKKNKCSQSSACRIVCEKHLKADGKTPIFSKRTIENWMSRANRRKKP